ncbi:hypothetical protein [Nonomuraea sp. 10N515B]|uniref:hypothetical protein n=1 Tax=Nonomuraea sp. 10N515B TaxID=3457422 RepID=UPI003FCCFAB0
MPTGERHGTPITTRLADSTAVSRSTYKPGRETFTTKIPAADGRLAQMAGFKFVYDPAGTAQVVDNAGTVLTPGTRIRSVTLNDGTVIVQDGAVVPGGHLGGHQRLQCPRR